MKHPEYMKGELAALSWSKDLVDIGLKHCQDLLANTDIELNNDTITVIQFFITLHRGYKVKIDVVRELLIEQATLGGIHNE